MKSKWWRIIQVVFGLAIVIAAILKVRTELAKPETGLMTWSFQWQWIAASLLMTWAMYAVLITGWRIVLLGWGEDLGWVDAARIWTISSLGALLPGRVWAIAGMATMAQQAGVSAAAATGSAIVMQLLSMTTGAILGLILVGPALIADIAGGLTLVVVIAGGALVGSVALTQGNFMSMISRVLKRKEPLRPLAPGALLTGLVLNTVAWAGYGTALFWLVRGTMPPTVELSWTMATGAFALAYLVGYVVFLAPAGLGVRDLALVVLMTPQIGAVPAAALAVASRLATLTNQFGAAVPFLLFRSAPREHT